MHLLTQESPCWLEEGLFFLYAAEASEAKENRVQHSNPRILYTRENVQKQARLGFQITGVRKVARIFHELLSRDRGEECATGQPQGVGSEAYLNSTSQGPIPEDARKDGHSRGRSRQFMEYPG